jgi:hypothetical protein
MALHLKSTGIDFTDFSNDGPLSISSELMDDYEEGTFSVAHGTIYTTTAQYTKIAREVCPNGEIRTGSISASAAFYFAMPFTCAGQAGGYAAGRSSPQQYIYLNMTNGTANCDCEAGTSLSNNYYFYFSLPYYAT